MLHSADTEFNKRARLLDLHLEGQVLGVAASKGLEMHMHRLAQAKH